MRTKPDQSYFVEYTPKSSEVDLVERVRQGVIRALADGHKFAFIVEDDDYYPETFFDGLDFSRDFIGSSQSTYYNLRNKTYQTWNHPKHSSLYLTGFRLEVMREFPWPDRSTPFLDVSLWNYVRFNRIKSVDLGERGAIGIKHGIGLCGGKGHKQSLPSFDKDGAWLREHTDSESFNFYQNLLL